MSKESTSTSSQRLEELQEGTRAAPKESELCLTLGEAFLRVNMVDEAAEAYQRAVELDPRSDLRALYWEWLGLVREMEGRLEEALEAYFQWLDADPVAISPLDRLGTLLVILGRWTDLRLLKPQFARRAEVASSPRVRESFALYTFVSSQIGHGEMEETREAALSALEVEPDSLAMRFLIGMLTYQEGQLELARGEFERVVELDEEGLWQERRFALDWNGTKARVMVAKLARLLGDVDDALQVLANTEDLERSDSEGLAEVAELLLENHRYSEIINLLSPVSVQSEKVERFRAEGHLGRGQWLEARAIFEKEAQPEAEPSEPPADAPEEGFSNKELSEVLNSLWVLGGRGKDISKSLSELLRVAEEQVRNHPVGACLILERSWLKGSLSGSGLSKELDALCQAHPDSVEVWQLAEQIASATGDLGAAQLASLMSSKLEHGSRPGPTGTYSTSTEAGSHVLVVVLIDSHPLVVKLEADIGRGDSDQLFGWGRELLRPGLELARGVLEEMGESRTLGSELLPKLSFFPKSFRVMITPIVIPDEAAALKALADGELGSVPFGFLLALLSALGVQAGHRIVAMGRLGLRGVIDGVPDLEEKLMALHAQGIAWDHLVLAEGGGFRLLRSPSWLWYGKPLSLVKKARDLVHLGDSHKEGNRQ